VAVTPPRNLADGLRVSATRLPQKAALLTGRTQVTYAELDGRVDAAAAGFQRLGLQPGDRVGLFLPNTPHFVEAFYGALRAGLVVVPLNTGFTSEEVGHILGDCGASAVVTADALRGVLEGVVETLPSLNEVIVTGTATASMGTRTWRQFLGEGVEKPTPVDVGGDDLALLPYTSGTTGRPKGAMLSHANLLANHTQMQQTRLAIEERDVVLGVLPLFHIYAMNVAMAFTLSRGATVLLAERFDPASSLESVVTNRASILLGAPPMFIAWLNTPGVENFDLASVRFAVSGAAALPRQVLERFESMLGICIWEGYGLTETSPVLTTNAMRESPRAGSVGRPVPGIELRLLDDKGAEVRAGDPGEIVVRGPNVFSGYWGDEAASKLVLDDEGWFRTGDVGLLDEGDLFIVDRKKDLVIVSGFNVYPREVEEVLYRNPKVAEAAVIGVPHPYTGEAVKAVIMLAQGEEATEEEIVAFCRRYLARFKCPEIVQFVDEIPHNAAGKVLRRELR
jgi:long-chain acyl-CoA synthetase